MDTSHTGHSAIVTGGNSGIGRATAAKLMAEGASVLVVDVQSEPSWTAEHLQYYQADVAAEGSPAGIVACALDHFGQLDFLINNAGMVGGSDVERMTDDAWDRILDVNLKAVFKLSRAAIPHLKNSRRGRIVNIGSIMSYLAGSGMGAYTTSKHAVAGLTKTLALELGAFGITANYILPGAIATGITAPAIAADPSFTEFWTKKSAIGRLGQPEDIANAINFLLTAEAAFITAHGLAVDGGVMVNP
jgi:NAD(P)-dependent dehydrogenase (short-subunit alcohol dehydrogenase family)